ncbi:hypothetical protein C9427_13605 [Mesorhizobium helmanticense]|uniref:Uncharacterized protein n=1 Tax=Mesorhizobium helmanticense TaxID=1776423 RepID=A0A2T4IVW1_9HYPH|nr:hypothetical protein C9427_13605 [Mesorhizobium helmanticense]
MVYPILANIIGSVSDDTEFLIDTARHDKIEIGWTGLRLLGNDLDGRILVETLSGRGDYAVPVVFAEEGPSFNAAQSPLGYRNSVKLLSSANTHYRTPPGLSLLGGTLLLRRTRPDYGPTVFQISADLSLNPTRFVRHHHIDSALIRGLRSGQPLDLTARSLLTRDLRQNSDGEHILDNNDNCIVERRKLRMLSPSIYRAHEGAYIRKAFEFLNSRIEEVSQAVLHASLRGQPTYNLSSVETYWERPLMIPIAICGL